MRDPSSPEKGRELAQPQFLFARPLMLLQGMQLRREMAFMSLANWRAAVGGISMGFRGMATSATSHPARGHPN
jgi:hypothetical protein